jgi:3-hydroxymyristoyl/3-hydroxydecanoyl-(acyl carrier protein) dehydratase
MIRHSEPLKIAPDHPALAGHFPGFPIVPGVVLLDEILYAIERSQSAAHASPPWQIGAVKFHHIARPGDVLALSFEWRADGVVHFEVHHSGTLIVSGNARRSARIRAVAGAR